MSNPVYISMEPLRSIRDLTVKSPTPGGKSYVKSPDKSPVQPSRGRVGQHIDRCINGGLIISMAAKESAPGAGDGGTKYEALQFVSDKITNCFSVDPLLVASSLFAKKMIPQSVLEAMLLGGRTNREKATQLMGAVLTDVKNLPGYFEAFMDVLQAEQSLEGLVELIEHQLKVYRRM